MEKYLNELQPAAEKLIHSYGLLAMLTLLLKWVASFAAMLVIFSCLKYVIVEIISLGLLRLEVRSYLDLGLVLKVKTQTI